jgi:hypothetical protein
LRFLEIDRVRVLVGVLAASCIALSPALTQRAWAQRAAPLSEQGGSLPLAEVLDLAKPYPNLVTQVRLRLVASNLKKEQVTCSGQRLANTWPQLAGRRLAPYSCTIGRRTVTITADQLFYDKAGYKLKAGDPDLAVKATKVVESRLKWSWK